MTKNKVVEKKKEKHGISLLFRNGDIAYCEPCYICPNIHWVWSYGDGAEWLLVKNQYGGKTMREAIRTAKRYGKQFEGDWEE